MRAEKYNSEGYYDPTSYEALTKLMSKCAEVWVFGKYISPGMQAEIHHAARKNIPVRYFTEECQEVTE